MSVGLDAGHWYDDTPVTAIALGTDSRIYAGTYGNGVFVSNDKGETWSPMEHQPDDARIMALAVDPIQTNILYAGTAENGVFVTADDGESAWNLATVDEGRSLLVSVLAVRPGSGGTEIFAGGFGQPDILMSPNHGLNWMDLNESATSGLPTHTVTLRDIAFDVTDSDVIYAAFDSHYSSADMPLYRSTNGGYHWESLGKVRVGEFGPQGMAVHVNADGDVLLGSNNGVWLVSAEMDGSWSWTRVNDGFRMYDAEAIALSRSGVRRIIAVGRNTYPVMSEDDGATWRHLDAWLPDVDYLSAAINPINSDEMWLGQVGEGGLFRGRDNGFTWEQQMIPIANPWVTAIAVDVSNPLKVLAVADNAGVLITENGGDTWNLITAGLPRSLSGTHLVISEANPAVVRLASWQGLFTSTDGGATWTETVITEPGEGVSAVAMDPDDENVLYAGSRNMGLWKSIDGGTTWALASDFLEPTEIAIDPTDGNRLLVGESRGVFASQDAGATWADMTGSLPTNTYGNREVTDIHFDPVAQNRYFVVSNSRLHVYDGDLPAGVPADDDSGGPLTPPGGGNGGEDDGGGGGGGGGSLGMLGLAILFVRLSRRRLGYI